MKRLLTIACVLIAFSILTLSATDLSPFFRPDAVRVLILSGRNNHDWRTTTPYLKELLLRTGRFDVRVCEEPAGMTSESLAPYHVLVLDYCGPSWGSTAEQAVAQFVKGGKGLVVVHGAIYGFSGLEVLGDGHKPTGIKESPWGEFRQMVGGGWKTTPPKRFHGDRHSFTVKIADSSHPITKDLGASFAATDELYHQMELLPDTKVLATAFDDPKRGGTGQPEPMLWVNQHGQGRVFYTALGHEVPAMQESGFIATFVRGTEWAATGKTALPPDAGCNAQVSKPLRLLVVTGGHAYESSFYSLFDGYRDLAWDHAATNQEAFKNDITGKYDVVLMYDMSQNLDDKGRKNLQAFVEAGKGLVVLHHAIANYQTWAWWSKEVVGGRYLLQKEGDTPGSTYKHDEELVVENAAQHAITAGLAPIHIWDETYKGMWISPTVKVLLKTGNPTSDGPVAWISPYEKSRVVCVQLGHDGKAYRHPAFRELVRRTIFWTAGRLGK
ncbi:MAG: ThuA domain-containing protein [Acidobacteria bacterium]|nr:MAG: ThuA domain-containing protein [Acidobacteriota bacterium]